MPKTDHDFAEMLTQSRAKEWREAIACRLEPMRAYLAQDEWQKGIHIWLKALMGDGIRKIIREKQDRENTDYLRGYVAALEQVLALPASVEDQIALEANKAEVSKERGAAGY